MNRLIEKMKYQLSILSNIHRQDNIQVMKYPNKDFDVND